MTNFTTILIQSLDFFFAAASSPLLLCFFSAQSSSGSVHCTSISTLPVHCFCCTNSIACCILASGNTLLM
uniref:Putative secreted peptide n=1 Tax=Anopheles braziliensis TaxID=58242 RepID=A0A2M3ZWC3_9DIPT